MTHKASLIENFLVNLSPKDGSLWRVTKRACKLNSPNLPIKKSDGSFVYTDSDKAELFKDFYMKHSNHILNFFLLKMNLMLLSLLILLFRYLVL